MVAAAGLEGAEAAGAPVVATGTGRWPSFGAGWMKLRAASTGDVPTEEDHLHGYGSSVCRGGRWSLFTLVSDEQGGIMTWSLRGVCRLFRV